MDIACRYAMPQNTGHSTCRSLLQETMYSFAECGRKRTQLMVDVWPCIACTLIIR
jgi:hypothetical protein